MKAKIVDTTLRDGEQRAGIALGLREKVKIAAILDDMGVDQIEAGTPAMKGEEKKSIQKIMELGLKSRISAWNRMNIYDIQHSTECGVHIIHITVPSSDIQIKSKMNKDRGWIIDNLKRCVNYAVEKGFEVTVGMEDASRADFKFLMCIAANAFIEGASRVRYADTVGILHMSRAFREIRDIKSQLNICLEIHNHNDLGMAVANSVSAVRAGVEYVDCTIGGIGERAGNCNYIHFIKAARVCLDMYKDIDVEGMIEKQNDIISIIKGKRIS